MPKYYTLLLCCLLSASYAPRVAADYYDMTIWETIQMAAYGLVSGAYFEDDRPGIKSAYKKGSQQSIIDFDVKAAQAFSGTLYLPMPSATFKIYSPDNALVFDSRVTPIKHNQSLKKDPKHPWLLYFLPELFSEDKAGKWRVEAHYPSAPTSGKIYLDVRGSLIFQADIKTDPDYRVISDELVAAVEVTSKAAQPEKIKANISITFPNKTRSHFIALNNGEGADNINSDAIFTVNETIKYQQLGLHVIESEVELSYLGKVYTLKKLKNIWVTEQLATIDKVKIMTEPLQRGCINEVTLLADIQLNKAGDYKLLGMLTGSENRYYGFSHTRFYREAGKHQIKINYPKKALLASFTKQDVISFAPLRILKMDHENIHTRGYNAYINKLTPIEETFQLSDLNFCREAIEVGKRFEIEEIRLVGNSKINALQLTFDVSVNHSGLYGYSVNFRHEGYVSSFGGRYHESQLTEGANKLVINIDANRLKEFEGGKVTAHFAIWKKDKGTRLDKKLSTTIRTYQPSDFTQAP